MSNWTQQGFSQSRPRILLIKSPFLLIRFVVFSLLIYMSLTALVFAAWNVGARRAAGIHVDGAPVFVLFNGIATPICIAIALVGIKISSFSTSDVGFECAWTGIFTILQIAASIFVTLSGPPEFCDANAPPSVCASITILVPISWIATTLLFGYFLAVLTLCVAHWRVHRALWSTPIHDVAWFDDGDKSSSAPQLPPLDTSPINLSILPPHLLQSQPQPQDDVDVENQQRPPPAAEASNREKSLPSSPRPNVWWDRLRPGQAGRDHPFAIRRPVERVAEHYYPYPPRRSSSSAPAPLRRSTRRNSKRDRPKVPVAAATLPHSSYSQPAQLQPQPWLGWQRKAIRRDSSSVRFGAGSTDGVGVMVDVVLDEDEPIPVGDRSQWVRAGAGLAPGSYVPPRPSQGGRWS